MMLKKARTLLQNKLPAILSRFFIIIFVLTFFPLAAWANNSLRKATPNEITQYRTTLLEIEEVFIRLGDKLRFFTSEDSLEEVHLGEALLSKMEILPGHQSEAGRHLPVMRFRADRADAPTVLWLGGIHPDEFVPSTITWLMLQSLLTHKGSRDFHIVYVPYLNPDGWIDGDRVQGYPTRTNGRDSDLNRSFYDRAIYPPGHSAKEVEFALDLILQVKPERIIIPHSSLMLLDLDGHTDSTTQAWLGEIHRLSGAFGGDIIPINDHPVYGDPNQKDQWSIGRWLTEQVKKGTVVSGLTFEFGGPYPHPGNSDPQRGTKLSKRKHLGRWEKNTYWAHRYFAHYQASLFYSLGAQIITPIVTPHFADLN